MSADKTHWKKFFNYEYMGSYSMDEYQDEPILTISKIDTSKVKNQDGREETCLICHFNESDKPMILNKTNCKIIEKIYNSPHVQDWIGKRVQIYATKVKAFGQMADALRIRDFMPKSPNESVLSDKKKEVRNLLALYEGEDLEEIKSELNKIKTGDVAYYDSIIKRLEV